MNHHEQRTHFIAQDTEQGPLSTALNKLGNYLKPVGRGLTSAAAGTALAIALVGCGVSAAEVPKDDDRATNTPSPDASPSATPDAEPTSTPEVVLPTIDQLEIPSGLEAEAVGKLIVEERLTGWANAGATDALKERVRAENVSWEVLVPQVAAENADVYAPALFGPNYANGEFINMDKVNPFIENNINVLNWYTATQWSDKPENTEGFRTWMTVDSVEQLQDEDPNDNERTIVVNYTDHTNADMNTGPEPQRAGGQWTFELTDDGDSETITALSVK